MEAEIVAFFDTNFCMHYKQPEDIDWCAEMSARRVRLVACAGVIGEIDRQKYHERLRDRAIAWSKRLHACRTGAVKVRENVTMELYLGFVDTPEGATGDPAIAAQAKHFADRNSQAKCLFVTADILMAIRCEVFGIKHFELKLEHALAPEKSDDKKRAEKAERALAEIKNRLLDVQVHVRREQANVGPGNPMEFELQRPKPINESHVFPDRFPVRSPHPNITRELRDNSALGKFHMRWTTWCDSEEKVSDESGRTIGISIQVTNEGKAQAKEITATISYSTEIFSAAVTQKYVAGSRTKQLPPPRYAEEQLMEFSSVPTIPSNYLVVANEHHPLGCTLAHGVMTIQLPRLLQGEKSELFRLYLTFKSWETVGPFKVTTKVIQAEPPDTIENQINGRARIIDFPK